MIVFSLVSPKYTNTLMVNICHQTQWKHVKPIETVTGQISYQYNMQEMVKLA